MMKRIKNLSQTWIYNEIHYGNQAQPIIHNDTHYKRVVSMNSIGISLKLHMYNETPRFFIKEYAIYGEKPTRSIMAHSINV